MHMHICKKIRRILPYIDFRLVFFYKVGRYVTPAEKVRVYASWRVLTKGGNPKGMSKGKVYSARRLKYRPSELGMEVAGFSFR